MDAPAKLGVQAAALHQHLPGRYDRKLQADHERPHARRCRLLSAPLHPSRWTKFDELVGHRRRYEPERLKAKLAGHGLTVTATALYGMQPRSSWLLDLAVWALTHRRSRAIWWYDRVFLTLGALFQRKLKLVPGMMDVTNVDEVLLACRKTGDAP